MKVIEVLSSSKTSWEDATQNAVSQASKTVKNKKSYPSDRIFLFLFSLYMNISK